jgi:hypothetical protein
VNERVKLLNLERVNDGEVEDERLGECKIVIALAARAKNQLSS